MSSLRKWIPPLIAAAMFLAMFVIAGCKKGLG